MYILIWYTHNLLILQMSNLILLYIIYLSYLPLYVFICLFVCNECKWSPVLIWTLVIFIMDKNIGSIVFHCTQNSYSLEKKHICTPADEQMQFLIGDFKNCQSRKNFTCIIVHNKSWLQKSVTLIKNEILSVNLLLHRN